MNKIKLTILRLLLALAVWATPGQVTMQIEINPTVVVHECVAQSDWVSVQTDK